jgi:hypothetical protein
LFISSHTSSNSSFGRGGQDFLNLCISSSDIETGFVLVDVEGIIDSSVISSLWILSKSNSVDVVDNLTFSLSYLKWS